MLTTRTRAAKIAWSLAIVLAAASAGILVDWQAPGIARFGRFPWSRQVIARTIDALAAARPEVIALDVLFTDPTTQEDDDNLARSIGHAGNVVVAAQLTDSPVHGGPSRWLPPLPAIERAAAAVGHVNVQTELDGIVRQVAIRLADDDGRSYRAMPVEAVRISDGTPEEGITDTQGALLLGARTIRLDTAAPAIAIVPSAATRVPTRVLHGGRMTTDNNGPAGSFGPVTSSIADVVAGRVPAEKLRGKYVMIGATAASLGDRVASPFVRYTDARADQHGALMPGIEVLANAIHVILSSRYYTESSDLATFLWGATVALLTLLLLEWAQGGREFLKQLGVLVGVAALVLLASYLAFLKLLFDPPMVACLVAFGCAGLLGLLRRSLVASARLDANIAELALSGDLLAPAGPGIPGPYHWAEGGPVSLSRGWLPKGLEWKARILSDLNARLLDRAKFVNFALRSVEDGLLIADPEGLITFANRSAGAILGVPARGLVGQNLTQRLPGSVEPETLTRLAAERGHFEREIAIRGLRTLQYTLRLAAVSADEKGDGPVLGIVASLSDVTRQYELQQTKNDVISLVSHE